MTATALVVDDEVDLCRLMQITLTKMGIKSDVAYDLAQAKNYWENKAYDFCLTDLQLPDGSGLELVQYISARSSAPVAVITAHGSMDLAIEALKLGAFDFVNKPLELPRLRQLVENALKVIRQDPKSSTANTITPEQNLLDQRLIGNTPVMHSLKQTVLKLSRSQAPVFLSGASGTGKEVVARLIHDLSSRRDSSFVAVNCGAIPSELMESEFFGHKKGSFTGAVADKQGLFQQANGGTLFLDEIADLPLAMQVKLLRAIQEKSVRAIGNTKETLVDIRILSATHKDLAQLVQTSHFRQDLYYRINVIELKLPTLNARSDDIPTLAQHFLHLIAKEWQLDDDPKLSAEAIVRLQHHSYAGNVRELRNLLERAITLSESPDIDVEHLGLLSSDSLLNTSPTTPTYASAVASPVTEQPAVRSHPYRANPSPLFTIQASTKTQSIPSNSTQINQQPETIANNSLLDQADKSREFMTNNTELTEKEDEYDLSLASQMSSFKSLPQEGLEAYLQHQEKQLIVSALKQTNWNKTQAAELLGTTFRSLRYRMKKLDIDEEQHNNQ